MLLAEKHTIYCTDLRNIKSRIQLDDNKLQNGSSNSLNSKYLVTIKKFQSKNSIVYLGKQKNSGLNVIIKMFKLNKKLNNGIPDEVFIQNKAKNIIVENGKGTVLKVIDWYVYDNYTAIVTEYNKDFKSLYDCTCKLFYEHFSEDECKTIFKSLLNLVIELHKNNIFHLDIKPQNFLYNTKTKQIKIIDFGHSVFNDKEKSLKICKTCGTEGLITPQQVEKTDCFGKDVDLWGVAQTIYFCLQGNYAFDNDSEVLTKKLQFKVKVSEECKDLITRMLAYEVKDRMTPYEILKHPWLN